MDLTLRHATKPADAAPIADSLALVGDLPALAVVLVSDAPVVTDMLMTQTASAARGAGAGTVSLSAAGYRDGITPLLEPGVDAVLLDLRAASAGDLDRLKRCASAGPDAPIVALLSEPAEPGVMLRALRAGAEDCVIFEPAEIGALAWTVRRAVERYRDRQKVEPQAAPAPAAPGPNMTLVQETPEALVILDRDGCVKFANPAAADLMGRDTDEMVGRPFAVPLEAADSGEVRLALPNGETRLAEMQIADSEWDGVPARIATLNDVTVRRKLEQTIKASRRSREETERRSRTFFSNVNHDLRTPLTHIIGFSELMKDERFGPIGQSKYRDYARDIHSSGQMLLDMIEDLLGIAEAEAEEIELTDEICNPRQLIEIALASQQAEAREAGVVVELECPDRPPGLRGDARRLRQGLFRLISEALYCVPKCALLHLSVREHADGLSIRLQGGLRQTQAGLLPEADRDDPFVSAEGAGEARGTGLSLTLTRKVMELHGGSLTVTGESPMAFSVELRFPSDRLVR